MKILHIFLIIRVFFSSKEFRQNSKGCFASSSSFNLDLFAMIPVTNREW